MWAPWRLEYMQSEKAEGCVFCTKPAAEDDEANYIVHRGEDMFVILNAFPYNTGHLMVAPVRHVGEMPELSDAERHELIDVVGLATTVIKDAMGAHGFNVGMNLGQVAGAGIPGHLHVHVVPRWGGDTNFMPVVGDTKVLPEMIEQTDAKLRPLFARSR